MARGKQGWIKGSFVPHRIEMRRSLAWSALPWAARRLIDRLELEHMEHAGTANGNLVCTYDNLKACGMDRRATASGIVYAERLGFVSIAVKGRQAAGDNRTPSRYRLTYLPTRKGAFTTEAPPTDDWAQITTEEQLEARLKTIDRELAERHEQASARWKRNKDRKDARFSGRKDAPGTACKNAPGNPMSPDAKMHLLAPGAETHPTSTVLQEGGRSARFPSGAVADRPLVGAADAEPAPTQPEATPTSSTDAKSPSLHQRLHLVANA
jgi:hypothetical protein